MESSRLQSKERWIKKRLYFILTFSILRRSEPTGGCCLTSRARWPLNVGYLGLTGERYRSKRAIMCEGFALRDTNDLEDARMTFVLSALRVRGRASQAGRGSIFERERKVIGLSSFLAKRGIEALSNPVPLVSNSLTETPGWDFLKQ
jgi:hypothetical protein